MDSRMSSPSIVPNDRMDRDFYLVLEDFRNGATFRETDEGIEFQTLIEDLRRGEYGNVLRVVAFNPAERWSCDASEDVAREARARTGAAHQRRGSRDPRTPAGFHRGQLGRKIGVQLPLPLQI